MTYAEKLRDPRWQKKRLEIMSRDRFTCRKCQDATKTLNVHHRYYTKGSMPWEYPDDALVTFCEPCHRIIEKRVESINKGIHANDYRQEMFHKMLNAVESEGPYSYPGCGWSVDAVGDFLKLYEDAICDVDEEALDIGLYESYEKVRLLEAQVYEVLKGLMGCINEANRIVYAIWSAHEASSKIEVHTTIPSVNGSQGNEGFWTEFLTNVNKRRPLILHWVQAATLLEIGEGVVKLGFPDSEEIAMRALMIDTTRAFLEEAAKSILGREVTFQMVIDRLEVCK